ncbi:MAG: hypothetical protein Q4F79_01940 [Eubacteriales bacterium]|nr:hypothetical protein [Eubacteriales bacterium]
MIVITFIAGLFFGTIGHICFVEIDRDLRIERSKEIERRRKEHEKTKTGGK